MKFNRLILLGGLVAAASVASAAETVPGQLIVRYSTTNHAAINAQIGAQLISYNPSLKMACVKVPTNMTTASAESWFDSQPGVIYSQPNYIYRKTFVPNDPDYATKQYAPQIVKAEQGWDRSQGSSNVTIAIVDTGVSITHPDLAGKTVPGFDFVDNDNDPDDTEGHGTHCAGIAAANTNNGIGMAGLAPNCRIMPVRVLGPGGGTTAWVVSGITYAVDNGAKVVSLSLGGGFPDTALQDAGAYALSKGALPIAAAGNNGSPNKFYPAGFDEFLAVAATTAQDTRAGFSNYGADWVDVAAPGAAIYSTIPGDTYAFFDGTSMACPLVAGLAGVVKSVDPNLTPAALRSLIQNGCDPVGNFVAFGRVNLLRSIPLAATTDPYNMNAAAISIFEGTYVSGTHSNVWTSDNLYYRAKSVNVLRTGHVASATVTFNAGAKNPSTFKGLTLNVEGAAIAGVTFSVFVWDKALNSGAGGWAAAASMPIATADAKKTMTLSAPYTKWFDANKNCKVLVRAIYPAKPTASPQQFILKADQVQLVGRVPKP